MIVGTELLPQAADADLDDVRAWIEAVAPDIREQLLAADDLALVAQQVAEQLELAIGQVAQVADRAGRRATSSVSAPARSRLRTSAAVVAQLHPHARD